MMVKIYFLSSYRFSMVTVIHAREHFLAHSHSIHLHCKLMHSVSQPHRVCVGVDQPRHHTHPLSIQLLLVRPLQLIHLEIEERGGYNSGNRDERRLCPIPIRHCKLLYCMPQMATVTLSKTINLSHLEM